jgi:hypothetical protein
MAAVKSGASVGERVVVDGKDRLRDGARVIMSAAPNQASRSSQPANAPTASFTPAMRRANREML